LEHLRFHGTIPEMPQFSDPDYWSLFFRNAPDREAPTCLVQFATNGLPIANTVR